MTMEQEFTAAATEYNRRVNNGMSKSYISAAWRKLWALWDASASWAKKWVVDPLKKIVHRVLKLLRAPKVSKYDQFITYSVAINKKTECFYALYIRSAEYRKLIAAKVGTTKDIITRMRDEIKAYTESYGEQVTIEVVHFVRHENHAQTIANESFFRWAFIQKYPDYFKDNDRFSSVEIGLNEIQEVEKLMHDTREKLLGRA